MTKATTNKPNPTVGLSDRVYNTYKDDVYYRAADIKKLEV